MGFKKYFLFENIHDFRKKHKMEKENEKEKEKKNKRYKIKNHMIKTRKT